MDEDGRTRPAPVAAMRWVLAGYVGWVATWAAVQVLGPRWGGADDAGPVLAFLVGVEAVAGIGLPLVLGRRAGLLGPAADVPFALTRERPRRVGAGVVGIAAFGVALLAGLVGSGALAAVVAAPPDAATLARYLLLFPGLALAVTLHCFVLVPRAVRRVLAGHRSALPAAVLAGAGAVALAFWADQRFGDPALAGEQALLGLALATGALLTRSVWGTATVYLVVVLGNTVADGRYDAAPWPALAVGVAAVLLAVGLGGLARTRPPAVPALRPRRGPAATAAGRPTLPAA